MLEKIERSFIRLSPDGVRSVRFHLEEVDAETIGEAMRKMGDTGASPYDVQAWLNDPTNFRSEAGRVWQKTVNFFPSTVEGRDDQAKKVNYLVSRKGPFEDEYAWLNDSWNPSVDRAVRTTEE